MRAIVSVVLAATLVTTPLKLVLAQARQQESQVVDTTDSSLTVADPAPSRIGVPVEGKGALLWLAGDLKPSPTDSVVYFAPFFRRTSSVGTVALVFAFLLALALFISTLSEASEL